MTNCGSQSAYIRWCAGRDIDAVSYITLKDVAAGIHLTVSDNGRGIESLSRRRLSPLEPGSGSPPDTGLEIALWLAVLYIVGLLVVTPPAGRVH
jgi:hypothetical protein